MLDIMNFLPLFIILFFLGISVAAGSAMLEGYLEGKDKVRTSPREPMFWCHKHGPFRKKHCLPLFPELGGKAENSFICPTCYKEIVFDEPNKRLKV